MLPLYFEVVLIGIGPIIMNVAYWKESVIINRYIFICQRNKFESVII